MKRMFGMLAGAAALVGLALSSNAAAAADKVVRIGYQKYGTLIILKEQGLLEKKLAPLGYSVAWTEFPGGPQLLEALNVGALDFGTTGEAPPIFAQAAGAPLLYVGYEPPSPKGEAILVPKDSPIQSVAQLKGRKVALNKGSNVHYLLVKALEKEGLSVTDIEPVYLPPADARAAFERGAVDAWAIWDPFYASASAATGARTLADGTGLVKNHQFFLAAKPYAAANQPAIDAVLAGLREVDEWAAQNVKAVAEQLSPKVGLPVSVLDVAAARQGYGLRPIDAEVIAEQQRIADTFFALKLIPRKIDVSAAAPGSKS
ncbi:sulfonate transport system substrate-binding protein [Azospirillum agricola]|uniref:sulfonate ABC transporter substrate-binding protein n=1 Tax=Azospirillum agricola TaxID=1720247 RepID=UPI001AE22B27|nr:sulfonate ABC transporter substrate-binding protein [Azospirillum agricola]MBP2230124.1 sulfonate transport system substrate-binding protein [Azospirillum agricola]